MYRALRRSVPQVGRRAPSAAVPAPLAAAASAAAAPSCSCSRHLFTPGAAPATCDPSPRTLDSSLRAHCRSALVSASPKPWGSSRALWTCAYQGGPPSSHGTGRRRLEVRSVTTKEEVKDMGEAIDRAAAAAHEHADDTIQPDAAAPTVDLDLVYYVLPKREVESLPQSMIELIARKVEQIGAPGKKFDEMSFPEIQAYHAKFYKSVTPEERLQAAAAATHTDKIGNKTLAQAGVRPETLVEEMSAPERAAHAATTFRDFERDMRDAPNAKPELLNHQLFLALSHGAPSERVSRARYVVSRARHFGHEDKLDRALVEEIARVEAGHEGKAM